MCAIPQAIEWSFATPMISPRFPFISPGMVSSPSFVMPGLGPDIQVFLIRHRKDVDARHKAGHDVDGRSRDYASSRLNTTDALVPPKPKEFDSTAPIFTSSLRARAMGMSSKAGSRFSIFALSQMKPLFIIKSE